MLCPSCLEIRPTRERKSRWASINQPYSFVVNLFFLKLTNRNAINNNSTQREKECDCPGGISPGRVIRLMCNSFRFSSIPVSKKLNNNYYCNTHVNPVNIVKKKNRHSSLFERSPGDPLESAIALDFHSVKSFSLTSNERDCVDVLALIKVSNRWWWKTHVPNVICPGQLYNVN